MYEPVGADENARAREPSPCSLRLPASDGGWRLSASRGRAPSPSSLGSDLTSRDRRPSSGPGMPEDVVSTAHLIQHAPPLSSSCPGKSEAWDAGNTESAEQPNRWLLPSRTTSERDFCWGFGWIFDIILTVLPAFFVAAAIMALWLDHQPHSQIGEQVYAATRLGPTVFPIVFAGVAGRLFQNLARWCLERPDGIPLGALEQIVGSQSFAGAVHRTFAVRSGTVLPAAILFVWALSPIGGQSSLRLFHHGDDVVETTQDVYYADPRFQRSYWSPTSARIGKSMNDFDLNSIHTLYSNLFLSAPSRRAALTDTWDRPKIPQLPRSVVDDLDFSWHDVRPADLRSGEDYSSLLGIDVRGIGADFATRELRVNVTSEYLALDCKVVPEHTSVRYNYSAFATPDVYIPGNTIGLQNDTARIAGVEAQLRDAPRYLSWYLSTARAGFVIYYDSIPSTADVMRTPTRFECATRFVPVEVEFACGPAPATGCGARRQRQRDPRYYYYQEGGHAAAAADATRLFQALPWNMNYDALMQTLDHWLEASGAGQDTASLTDNYLAGDAYLYTGQGLRDWEGRDAPRDWALFSRRMTTAFNTMYQVSLNPRNVTSADPADPPASAGRLGAGDIFFNATRAHAYERRAVYVADRAWCASLLLIGAVLQLLAVAGLWLRAAVAGPDILGYASSLTRDNPYVPPEARHCGSALGGADRARRWRHMRLQIADVRPHDERGYLVFKPVTPSPPDGVEDGDGDGRPRGISVRRVFL